MTARIIDGKAFAATLRDRVATAAAALSYPSRFNSGDDDNVK